MRHALVWNAAFNVFRDLLGLVVMLVLVRLLEPAHYGQFALVTAIIGLVSVFGHQNFIAHTLQLRDDRDVHYQDHFTVGGSIQVLMFLITNGIAFGIRFIEDYASISPLIHVMSIGFLLEWPCELRLKMLERSLNWARLRFLHGIGLVVSSVIAICMGYLGAGVYALLVPGLLIALPFIFDLFYIEKWRPTWTLDRERYMPAFKFGLNRLTSGLMGRSRRLIESGVVVYVLGFSAAGLLERAVSLGLMFCHRVAMQIMYTLYPVVTRLEPGSEEYRRASSIVLRGVTWFTIPVAMLLALLAAPFVHVVYGGNWDEVVPLVPVAVVLGGVAAVFSIVYTLLLGLNQERRCLISDVIELLGTLVALVFLARGGLIGYLLALLVVRIVVLFIGTYWLLLCDGLSRKEVSNSVFPALVSSSIAYAVCQSSVSLTGLSPHDPSVALIYGIAFLSIYLIALRMLFSDLLIQLINYLPANRRIGRVLLFPRSAF